MVDRWCRAVLICVVSFFFLFGHTLEQQFLVSRPERLALLQLRTSLGLRAKEWPAKSDPCASWPGIHCTNGRVTGINVSGFRRTRKGSENPRFSVDALQKFTVLSSFNASNFPMPGSIPDWFGLELPALQVLDLRSCSLHGVIPFTLGNLSSLVQLYLSENNLTGVVPSSLGWLLGLSALDLSRNLLTGSIPATFAALGNLTFLDMSLNFFSGAIPYIFGNLSSLRFLNLSGNSLSSLIPAQLGNLSTLVELDLGFNALSGAVPLDLRKLRHLRRIVLENNLLSGPLPVDLFFPLTQVQFVGLNHNSFSGDFPNVLWSIPSLQFLDASANNFTGPLPNFSSVGIAPSVAVFNVSRNLLYGYLTPVIRRFGFIDLSGNYFEGPVPIYARGNTSSLGGNCFRNEINQRNTTECASFYADRNLLFGDSGEPNVMQPSENKSHTSSVIILASVIGGVGLIALLIAILVMVIVCNRKRGATNARSTTNTGPVASTGGNLLPAGAPLNFSTLGDAFTYQQILQATGEFNDASLMKRGHSGDLFWGKLEGGIPVIIKKIDLRLLEKKETYMLELEILSKVSHPRLIPLLGHCLENENEKFLVYKHMPNRDLSTSLFKNTNPDDDSLQSLDWITRLKIATGAAEGLSYLHHECNPPLVHRDVKASSILLDDKYEVRLGSLSEVCAQEGDVHQNRITRFLRSQTLDQGASGTPNATCSYDVYCFGKVLLELVTGKLGLSSSNDAPTKEWLEATLPYISIYDKELVTNIVDPSLIIDEDLLEEVWAMSVVAKSCLNPRPIRRPLMRYILKALENPLKVVREESTGSARLRTTTSSRGSWNAALFGSWRHSFSDVGATSTGVVPKFEGISSFKQLGNTTGSQGIRRIGDVRRYCKDIFPEPFDEENVERGNSD
ncbi:probable LRR receptor-like serine/threonine-protein kinase at2g16250 [Phtheirospermum japonicum]|uniref:Probable LRR receptor-like serine/threonine-protein kinase at2g16250 n=1 Tax=Phtheirospermum japonicum TaxID=374723 RepID=A0A830CJU3_9LAMI|nr:probable LRR receptor-like serine/threonine-protein kinase at2g16250 [Phtheirospermum japonicum]